MCDSEQGEAPPHSSLHVLHLSAFQILLLWTLFFPLMSIHFLKSLIGIFHFFVVSHLWRWTSRCPYFFCTIVSLTSLLGGPLNGYDVMVCPSDHCWYTIISFFVYVTNDITTNDFAWLAFPAFSSTSLHLVLTMAFIFSCCIPLSVRLWAHSGRGSSGANLCISCRMYMNVCCVCVWKGRWVWVTEWLSDWQADERIDGWISEWMNEWTNEWVGEWMDSLWLSFLDERLGVFVWLLIDFRRSIVFYHAQWCISI